MKYVTSMADLEIFGGGGGGGGFRFRKFSITVIPDCPAGVIDSLVVYSYIDLWHKLASNEPVKLLHSIVSQLNLTNPGLHRKF